MQEAAANNGGCTETCILLGKRGHYEGVESLTCCQGDRFSASKQVVSTSASRLYESNASATALVNGSVDKLSITKSAIKVLPMLPPTAADINGENTESQEESHH